MPYVNNQGIKIYYEVIGNGFPVVLHTGAGGDRRMWQEAGYVGGLAGFQYILLDHRVHGKSDKPQNLAAHRLEHYVTDVVAALDALQLPRVAFWGYSDGRRVGYELAHRYPDRVAALLASGGMEAADVADYQAERQERAESADFYRERGMSGLIAVLEEAEHMTLPAWLRQNFLETDAEMVALELLAWCEWDGPWLLLPHLLTPTLLLLGEDEDDGNAARAAEVMPNTRCLVFPGLGHIGAFLRGDLPLPHAPSFLHSILAAQ